MRKATGLIAAILLALGLIELTAALIPSGSSAASTPDSATQPTAPATQPTSWDIPAIVSPTAITPAADPAIARLIDAHNANEDRIASARLTAQCTWTLDMPGQPRPMTIHYTRDGEKAAMTCGTESCTVAMGHVKMAPGSALNVDGLYLLMFRKYDGGQFKPAKAEKPDTIRATCGRETLDFDAATGRLAHAELQAKEGQIVADFAGYAALKDNPRAMIPTKIDIAVPADMYPFYRAADGKISLRISGESVVR